MSRNAGTCRALRRPNAEHHSDTGKEGTNGGRQLGPDKALLTRAQGGRTHGGRGAEQPTRPDAEPSPASGPRRCNTAGAGVLRRGSKSIGSTQLALQRAPRSQFTDLVGRPYGQTTAKLLQVQRARGRRRGLRLTAGFITGWAAPRCSGGQGRPPGGDAGGMYTPNTYFQCVFVFVNKFL